MFPQAHGFLPNWYYGGFVAMAAAPALPGLVVTSVTAENFEAELDAIAALLQRYNVVVIDTEYPGTVHRPAAGRRECGVTPGERYALVKANVDELPAVQLGITLCDADGNVPVAAGADGRACQRAWEFTFSDFDPLCGRHAPASVAFLASQGVDFPAARLRGVSSAAFAARLAAILAPARLRGGLTWVAFGSAYDFAYMVKMLSGGQPLPGTWQEFMTRARELLGGGMFDAKYMAEQSGRADLIGGGLRRVAGRLGAPLLFPQPPCLAGPKSHSACHVYTAMRRHFRDLYNGLYDGHDYGAIFDGRIDGFN